jgi:hypothetical protein
MECALKIYEAGARDSLYSQAARSSSLSSLLRATASYRSPKYLLTISPS